MIVRIEVTDSNLFNGLNNEPFVISVDREGLKVGDILRPVDDKPVEGVKLGISGDRHKVKASPVDLVIKSRLKDGEYGVFRYFVNHNHESPEYSFPNEYLAKGAKLELIIPK